MAVKQETIILHDFEGAKALIRRRTTSRGTRDRVSIEIEAEPIVHVFDDTALGSGPSQAIRDELEKAIKAITAIAKPSTIIKRNWSRREMESGSPAKSTKKRYSGGRIGTKIPKTSVRLFNDSDRLSEGLFVRQNPREGSFTTNVPANRFTDDTQHLVKRLFDLVPILRSPAKLLASKSVRDEIDNSINLLISKARTIGDAKRKALQQQQLNVAKAVIKLFIGAG